MPLRTESLDDAQLNLTPMIDIVFLLIIFFMVGTRFSEIEQQFDVELPTAEAVQPMTSPPDALAATGSPAARQSPRQSALKSRARW